MTKFKIKDEETNEEVELEIDLNEISVKQFENHNKLIQISDTMYLQMRYPKIDQLRGLAGVTEDKKSEALFGIMMSCIESVATEDEVYKLDDFSNKEVNEFIDSLSSKNIEDIKAFFDTIPVLRFEKEYTNSKGNKHKFVVEGVDSFFI